MTKSSARVNELSGLLIDTWWYGLTRRLSEKSFRELAQLRVSQGFSGIQLVAGIPPEVGPAHPQAASEAGPAWTLAGNFNPDYLRLAAARIRLLNNLGLRVIVYGAWGQQISWLGREKMIAWWEALVRHLDDRDVIYCLTGESNSWIGQEGALLPDRSTTDLWQPRARRLAQLPYMGRARNLLKRLRSVLPSPSRSSGPHAAERREDWSAVLSSVAGLTSRPLIIHTTAGETSERAVNNAQLLAAITTQTGHSQETRDQLWQIPLQEQQNEVDRPFINLEPWYEGINNNFYAEDQLYAYWVSALAGAASCCYGAHGIWNVGDGRFLAHWGRQSFAEACQLETPRLLGLSHAQLQKHQPLGWSQVQVEGRQLLSISRNFTNGQVTFYPDISRAPVAADGEIWLPLEGRYASRLPANGPAVIFA